MTGATELHLDDLARFVRAAPSPFHAAAESARRLEDAGWSRLDEAEPWPVGPGRHYVVRGGSLVAWTTEDTDAARGFRIVGAHTDSPNLRIRPRPDRSSVGIAELGVEVYGSSLLESWFDLDLGLSGRVAVRTADGIRLELLAVDEPLLRIPRLAIHLDRGPGTDRSGIDPQRHLVPVWSTGGAPTLREWLADRLGVDCGDVLSWDLMTHDLTAPARTGVDGSFFASARLDNLLSCHAGVEALVRAADAPGGTVPVLALFDHEEVGSTTASGAAGELLATVLERITLGAGLGRDSYFTALARSACISADGAHATHPNWPERHEPEHAVLLDAGPVLKTNANSRYATDARGAALVVDLAASAAIPLQHFVSRNDLPCGSTIGPVTAARLGITTVDVGVSQLSMHSARETTGVVDPHRFSVLLDLFLRDATALP